MLIEVCANGLESALRAEVSGADRIELCSELSVGGITPSAGCLEAVLEAIKIPVHVLLRPRSGPFTYNRIEWRQIEAELDSILETGAQGLVWGSLTPDFEVDTKSLERILKRMEQAPGVALAFHRAIDWVRDRNKSLKELTHYPVDTVLTSGGRSNAEDALEVLVREQQMFEKLSIMPGGGIHSGNIARFKEAEFRAVHFSGTAFEERGIPRSHQPPVLFNQKDLVEEFGVRVSSEDRLRQVFEIVKSV